MTVTAIPKDQPSRPGRKPTDHHNDQAGDGDHAPPKQCPPGFIGLDRAKEIADGPRNADEDYAIARSTQVLTDRHAQQPTDNALPILLTRMLTTDWMSPDTPGAAGRPRAVRPAC